MSARAAGIVGILALASACGREPTPPPRPGTVAEALSKASPRFGIEIESATSSGAIATRYGEARWAAAKERDLAKYAPLFLEELGRYSPTFLRDLGLRRVVVGSALAFADQPRMAIPLFVEHALHLDATAIR